jgi:hypothetical protein
VLGEVREVIEAITDDATSWIDPSPPNPVRRSLTYVA